MTTANRAFRSYSQRFTDGPEFALFRCMGCEELVESVDSHTHCADCAADRDAADEREAALSAADDAAELNAWCDALREAAIEHQLAAECGEERPLAHRAAA